MAAYSKVLQGTPRYSNFNPAVSRVTWDGPLSGEREPSFPTTLYLQSYYLLTAAPLSDLLGPSPSPSPDEATSTIVHHQAELVIASKGNRFIHG